MSLMMANPGLSFSISAMTASAALRASASDMKPVRRMYSRFRTRSARASSVKDMLPPGGGAAPADRGGFHPFYHDAAPETKLRGRPRRADRLVPGVSRRGDRLRAEAARADPAGLGDVDHHAVGAAVLHLHVGVMDAGHPDAEGAVDVVAGLGPGRRQLLLDLLEVLDLEADAVAAAPVLAALHACHLVVLEVVDG